MADENYDDLAEMVAPAVDDDSESTAAQDEADDESACDDAIDTAMSASRSTAHRREAFRLAVIKIVESEGRRRGRE